MSNKTDNIPDMFNEINSDNSKMEMSNFKCTTCDISFSSKSLLKKHTCKNDYSNKKRLVACEYCVKTFCTQNAYNRHLNANHFIKKIICNICNREFKLKRQLMQHHYDEHTEAKIFECDICKATFSWKKNLERHRSSCEIERIRQKHFNSQSELSQVLSNHDNNGKIIFQSANKLNKPWVCTICGKDFQYDFSFKAHMAGHDFYNQSNLQSLDVSSLVEMANESRGGDDEIEILIEVTNNDDEDVQTINDSYQLNCQLAALNNQNTQFYEQPTISMPTRSKTNLSMTKNKPFACEICDMRFMWQISLDAHKKQSHQSNIIKQPKNLKNKIKRKRNSRKQILSKIIYKHNSDDDDSDVEDDEDLLENDEATRDSVQADDSLTNSHLEAYLTNESINNEPNQPFSITSAKNKFNTNQQAGQQPIDANNISDPAENNGTNIGETGNRAAATTTMNYVPIDYAIENGHLALYLTSGELDSDDLSKQQKCLIAADVLCGMLNDENNDLSTLISQEEYNSIVNNVTQLHNNITSLHVDDK